MTGTIIALAVCAVLFASWFAWRKATPRRAFSGYLLLYDEVAGWRALDAVYTTSGVVADDVTYPSTLPSLSLGSTRVWICVASAPALVEHQALERAREAAALSALWRGGGQWLDYLRIAGVVVPAVLVWLVYSRLDAIFPLLAEILVRLEK